MMNLHFVLTEPEVPENIGAATRAIKTMGFDSLWLVNTNKHLEPKASYVAHGSNDILENARVFDTFDEMLNRLDFSVATTSKARSVRYEYHRGEELPELLRSKSSTIRNAGIIFGREEYGLKNEELKKCHLVSYLPMKTTYPSLNLGQSVMLYAYLISGMTPKPGDETTQPVQSELKALVHKVEKILPVLDLSKSTNIYGRIMERLMHVEHDDIHLLHSLCNELMRKLDMDQ